MYNLTDRSVVLGVTGSIAVYKAVDLASKLALSLRHGLVYDEVRPYQTTHQLRRAGPVVGDTKPLRGRGSFDSSVSERNPA